MQAVIADAMEYMESDMLEHGYFLEFLRGHECLSDSEHWLVWLERLLEEGVVIGSARSILGHTEFIGWRGSLEVKLTRAFDLVNESSGDDCMFAYWLVLPRNVDRFEDEASG